MLTLLALLLAAQVSTSTSTERMIAMPFAVYEAMSVERANVDRATKALVECDAVRAKLRNRLEQRDGELAGERAAHEQTRRLLTDTPPPPADDDPTDVVDWVLRGVVVAAGAVGGAAGGGALGAELDGARGGAIGGGAGALVGLGLALLFGGVP